MASAGGHWIKVPPHIENGLGNAYIFIGNSATMTQAKEVFNAAQQAAGVDPGVITNQLKGAAAAFAVAKDKAVAGGGKPYYASISPANPGPAKFIVGYAPNGTNVTPKKGGGVVSGLSVFSGTPPYADFSGITGKSTAPKPAAPKPAAPKAPETNPLAPPKYTAPPGMFGG